MKPPSLFRKNWHIALLLLALLVWLASAIAGAASAPEDALQRALRRVAEAGGYRFTAAVEQTLIPRPLPEMIGQHSQHVELRLAGEARPPDYARVDISSAALDGLETLTLLQTAEGIFVQVDDALHPVETPYANVAATADYLSFLHAAVDIRALPSASNDAAALTGFAFQIDGRRLADFYRAQTESALRASGELPGAISLAPSPVLASATGSGELWLDENGLPRRMTLHLDQPGASREYDARARVTLTFSDYGALDTVAQPVRDGPDGAWRLTRLPVALHSAPGAAATPGAWLVQHLWQPATLLCLLLLGAAALCVLGYRRYRRQIYALITTLVILSMLFTPLLQSLHVTRFFARLAAPPAPVLAAERLAPAAAPPVAPAAANAGDNDGSANGDSLPDIYCGSGEPDTDTDGDGISDRDENCLGTDYAHEDSDRDGIPDNVELDGLEWPPGSGRMWYGNPLSADTNGDGVLDTYGWPEPYGAAPEWDIDGDGVPNPWDDDSDGDGVPDRLDISPYVYTDYVESFPLTLHGGDFDGYAFIELQVQPQNPAHLRYALSALNWPYDDQGQVRDLDNSPDDLQLIPVLEIQTNSAPDRELAVNYGVIVFENAEDADYPYTLYASVYPVEEGGRIVAFSAKIAYEPEKLAAAGDIHWAETRLLWLAQMQNDTWSPFFYKDGLYQRRAIPEPTVLNAYVDTFRVTGLQVSIGRNFESAILGTPQSPNNDRALFQAALAVGATFMTYQTPTLGDVMDRFANPDPNADPLYTWGLHPADVAEDAPVTYGNRDEGLIETNRRLRDFLHERGYPGDSRPSLLTLMQEDLGVWTMGEGEAAGIPAQFDLNLNNIALTTQRATKLTTYEYTGGDWQALSTVDALHLMQERYAEDSLEPARAGLADDYPDLTTADLQATVLMFYTAWLNGRNKISQADGEALFDPAPDNLDQQTYDDVHLPAAKYDNLAAYLFEAAELGEPGGGARLGSSPAQTWAYQRAQAAKVDAFSFAPVTFGAFHDHLAVQSGGPLPPWQALQVLNALKLTFSTYTLGKMLNVGVSPLGYDRLLNHKLGTIATGMVLFYIWGTFFAGLALGDYDNPLARNTALAYALATTIFTLVTFALSFNPIGAAVLVLFTLADIIVLLVTWGGTSLTASVVDWLSKAFYDVNLLTSLDDIDFKDVRAEMRDATQGMVVGNRYIIYQTFEGTLDYTSDASEKDLHDSTALAWFAPSSDRADAAGGRGPTTCYKVDRELDIELPSLFWSPAIFSDLRRSVLLCTNEAHAEFLLTEPGRNISLEMENRVYARTYYEECGLWGASCDRSSVFINLPDDLTGHARQRWRPTVFYVDVLPDTVTGLWEWDEIRNPDRDADGLSNAYEAELGTDPDLWDTDGDGLSDKFELDNRQSLGADPLLWDTDGDGLSDGLEYRLGTGIDQPDTDGDGLLDSEEVFHLVLDPDTGEIGWAGGWWVTNLPESDRAYWIYADPLEADADGDGLNDKVERAYATSPYAYNPAPRLRLQGDPLAASPSGARAVYRAPGDPLTFDITLDNIGPSPISATLTLCLPDFVTGLQGGEMQGDQTPARAPATGCPAGQHGFQWDFTGPYTLHVWESVSTTVTAHTANAPSARGDAVLFFPYELGDSVQDIEARVALALDNEPPTVSFSVPENGALLGGGINDIVIGGHANDATSWVARVTLDLPGEGLVVAEGENPWAYTWELPADGVYDLTATAYDYLERASAPAVVQVIVDNTAPTISLDLEDGAHIAATDDGGGVITITLTGTAGDNLSGLTRVQLSLDGKPWREVWQSDEYPLAAVWQAEWTLPDEASASGEHVVLARALDRAGNASAVLERTVIVDVLPPTSEMGDRIYAQTVTDPPHVPVGEPLTLVGVANDVGNVPAPSRPRELLGKLDGLYDATIWLGLPNVQDNDDGVALAWIGDFNNDRLADLAIGLPAADEGAGRVVLVYGQAGDWPAPDDAAPIADSRTLLRGADGAGLGAHLAFAGDANGDGLSDFLVGDPHNRRAFLVFGSLTPLGRDVLLDGTSPHWSVLTLSDGSAFGARIASAGDVDGDGIADLLLGAGDAVYLLLGQLARRDEIYVDQIAAVQIDAGTPHATFAALGDVDGDGYDDWAIASGNTIYLFLGRDNLNATPPHPAAWTLDDADATFTSATSNPQIVALGDVDGDGLADWLYQSGDTPRLIFGDADHDWRAHTFSFDPPASGFLAAPGDVDGDGRADVLLGNANGDAYLILGANLDAVQATLTGVDAAASAPYPAGADLNSDGSSDLLLLPAQPADTGINRLAATPDALRIPAPASLPVHPSAPAPAPAAAMPLALPRTLHSVAATTRYVDSALDCDGQSPCYATIQAAIHAADAGDTIHVLPGAYASFIVDGKHNLTLSGAHPDGVFVDGAGGPYAVKIKDARGVHLSNMTLRNAANVVVLENAGVDGDRDPALLTRLQHLLIYDFAAHALSLNRASAVELSSCTLAGGKQHIEVTGDPPSAPAPAWSTLSPAGTPAGDGSGGGLAAAGGKLYAALNAGDDALHVYDPSANAWSARAAMPLLRAPGAPQPAATDEHLYALPGATWEALGSGFGSGARISDTAAFGDDVYFAGQFTQVDGVAVNHLARWDGSQWYDVGGGVTKSGGGARLNSVAVDSAGNLYVAGDFDQAGGVAASSVALWDGSQWHALDTLPAIPTAVGLSGEGALYAGSCDAIPGGANGFWQWNGSAWAAISADECIYDLATDPGFPDRIAVAGWLVSPSAAGGHANVGRYRGGDGFWQKIGWDVSGPAYVLEMIVGQYGNQDASQFVIGGDFTITDRGVTAHNIAHWRYDCTDGYCYWHLGDMGGGTNGVVYALAWEGRKFSNIYVGGDFTQAGGLDAARVARWDGGQWYTLQKDAAQGVDAPVTALGWRAGRLYAAGDFTQAGGVSAAQAAQWHHPLYRYSIAGNTWTRLASLPQAIGRGANLLSDGQGCLYAFPGSASPQLFIYDIAAGVWTRVADAPRPITDGGAAALARGRVYVLPGGDARAFYRYDPLAGTWATVSSIPDDSGVASAGASLASDGGDWLYAILGGSGRHFLRYNVVSNAWEVLGDGSSGTPDDHDTPAPVHAGGALARVGVDLYAIPGGGNVALWRFSPLADYRDKLRLDHVAFTVQETATQGDWYNLSLDEPPPDFGVSGASNVWVGGAATAWTPNPTVWPASSLQLGQIVTHTTAAFLDPDRALFRLTARSAISAGYTTYRPDVRVPGDYASIQDAILSGANRVLVDAGQYAQAFYLLSGVEVIGPRADRAQLTPPPGHTGPLVTAEGVTGAAVKGFTLNGADSVVGVRAEGGTEHVTLARNILRGTTTAVEVHGADTHLEVVNNTIVGNAAGMTAYTCALPDVRNTIFAYNDGAGLTFEQPPPDPHAYWPFDEEAGATVFADASGNGHDATCSGAQCPAAGAEGRHGSALDFDGIDDTLWAATANPADLQTFSLAAWVYFDRLPNNQIMRLVTLASEKAVLRYDGIQGPGQLHFYATIGGQLRHIRVNDVLHVRQWHHVAGSYDGDTLRLYLDGRQVGALAVSGALGGGTGARLSHVTETLDGKLDEVYIFPRALSAAEIRGLYAGCAGGRHAYNLYWANGTDLDPAQPGPAELFLNPRFVDRLAHNYTTDEYSPVIDAGNPTDPHPPGTGERVDIGYIEQGRAAYYVDDDYCAGDDGRECLNDGLTWGVDAFARIQEALDVAGAEQERYGRETAGDITCRVYHSVDTPRDIISATYRTETFSSIAVPRGGFIVDVNVHHVRGTHSRVGDLDFILQSPSGTMTRLFAPVTCEEADFDLHFDDEAMPGNPPCPPTDGGTYRPAQPLAKYDGDGAAGASGAAGDWVLHIRNAANGEVGRVDAWGLEICTRETPPPLTVGVGPGLYTETVSVPSYVRLIGVDPDRVVLDAQGAGVPVTFDGAVQAEVSGFTLTGNPGGAGVAARGTAKDVVIQRNLIRDNQRGVDFSAAATGRVSFTTIANAERAQYGVVVAGRGSRVHVENTLIHNHTIGLYAHNNGLIFSDYNLLVANTTHFNPESIRSARDKTAASAGFVGDGDYHLTPGSPARDSASPHAPIPPGGGPQADIGYHELTALPLTVFLGRERLSTAIGAAGLAEVQAAVVPVSDPRAPIAETLPDAWQTVYSDAGQGALQTTWLLTTTPTVAGLQRLYSRAEDSVGNRPEDARAWYSGAFVADDTPPAVQWLAPLPGAVDTALELRAQVWDDVAGQFSVARVQFEVDGEVVAAEWAAERWDPAAGQPRVFRAWVTFTLGTSPTAIAVAYDKAGHRGASAPLLLNVTTPVAPDVTPPTLTVISPTEGSGVQPPVVFQGTVTDAGGSGVASVQVSLDNGITWLPAAVAGEQWSLTWHPPWQQDFVTYPAQVRARDKAGNAATLSVTFAIDNVPPTVDTRYGYRSLFWKEANPWHGRGTTRPGEHFDYPTEITIWAGWPWDGSDVEGDTLRYQYAVDQNPDTPPNPYGEWQPLLRLGDELPTEWFTLPGEWYVHLFYRDQAGNIAIQRYGPWYMGNFADTLINCNSRVQTIELDGYLDVENYEWTPNEFLDDDERGMEQGRARQSLYASWDGEGLYLGWQGAWWDVDGEMWAYLDTATLTGDTGLNHTVEYPYQTLPFKANVAIRVRGQNDIELYRPSGGRWYLQYPPEVGQDVSGGTEVKFSLVYELEAIQDMRLLAYAREPSRRWDPPGAVWAMFPTTNPLDGEWNAYYHWNTVCNPLIPINANQPRYTSVALYVAGEVSRATMPPIWPGPFRGAGTLAASSSGGSAPGNLVGPGDHLTYTVALENRETYTTPVMALDVFSPLEGAYTLPVPPMPPGEVHTFTLAQTLPDDLSGLTTLPFSVTLRHLDTVLAQDWLSYRVDSLPPTLTLASQVVCPGLQTLSGRASDGDGGGIGVVQMSTDRVQWQDVVGLHRWTAQVNVPVGVETLPVWLRAADVFGQAIELSFTLRTDTDVPTLTLALPSYLTGAYGDIGGAATDAGSWIERVEVQIGDEAAPWRSGVVYPANGGEQRWAFTWSLPRADGVPLPLRARVVDAGCNVSLPTPWEFVPVDNVPPVITVTQRATVVPLDDYLPGGDGAPVLTGRVTDDGGVASLSVTLVDPLGRAHVIPLVLAGDEWTFTPQLTEGLTGRYTLRVHARDAAGNLSVSPRYVMQVAEVSFEKTVQPAEDVPLGGVVTYTLVLRNHGAGLLAGVVITDPLPAEVTPLTQTVGTAFLPLQDNTLVWGPFTVAGGDSITLSFTARVVSDTLHYGRTVSNTAYASASGLPTIAASPAVFTIAVSPWHSIYLPLVMRQ